MCFGLNAIGIYWNVNVLKKIKRLGFLKESAEIERLYLIDTFINLNI